VALELWVEVDADPVRIRMAGRLDASTAANLDEVVRELLADGTRHFELCTDGLRVVDASAVGALADVERRIRAAGGTMRRVAPTSGPFSRPAKPSPPPPAVR
jgi:anti-anti-sigma factor